MFFFTLFSVTTKRGNHDRNHCVLFSTCKIFIFFFFLFLGFQGHNLTRIKILFIPFLSSISGVFFLIWQWQDNVIKANNIKRVLTFTFNLYNCVTVKIFNLGIKLKSHSAYYPHTEQSYKKSQYSIFWEVRSSTHQV